MTKDEQLEANTLLSEVQAQRDMAFNRCARYAVEIAKAHARLEELEKLVDQGKNEGDKKDSDA